MIFTVKPLQVCHYAQPITIECYIEKAAATQIHPSLIKEVCVVRQIGMAYDPKLYIEQIKEMDRRLEGQGDYFRVGAFGPHISVDESQSLQRLWQDYERIKGLKPEQLFQLAFPMHFTNDSLEWTQKLAFKQVIEQFRSHTSNCSESILTNFAVKQLYWMKRYLPEIFYKSQDMKQLRNLAYVGHIKRHELYFLYFLSLMGCNVCYMNPYEDIVEKYPECQSFTVLQRDKYLATQAFIVPEYKRPPARIRQIQTTPIGQRETTTPSMPTGPNDNRVGASSSSMQTRPNDNRAGANDSTTQVERPIRSVPSMPMRTQQEARPNPRLQTSSHEEALSYEALAALSEAVVMIRVYDRQGHPFKTGSGVVIHSTGYIITNHHVVEGGTKFEIMFENDTRTYETYQVIKYHPDFDLAVIKVERSCQCLPIRTSKQPVRGQQVVAIGSPLGLFNTISDGIVSANRKLEHVSMIQFTAPVSHGSSGGGLLDLYGCVIGLITGGFDEGQNINLAVDAETMWLFANPFIEYTK